jgi:hypothetical protein
MSCHLWTINQLISAANHSRIRSGGEFLLAPREGKKVSRRSKFHQRQQIKRSASLSLGCRGGKSFPFNCLRLAVCHLNTKNTIRTGVHGFAIIFLRALLVRVRTRQAKGEKSLRRRRTRPKFISAIWSRSLPASSLDNSLSYHVIQCARLEPRLPSRLRFFFTSCSTRGKSS